MAQWTKIPVQKLAEKESERLMKLEKTLHKRVIGQEEAVTACHLRVFFRYSGNELKSVLSWNLDYCRNSVFFSMTAA